MSKNSKILKIQPWEGLGKCSLEFSKFLRQLYIYQLKLKAIIVYFQACLEIVIIIRISSNAALKVRGAEATIIKALSGSVSLLTSPSALRVRAVARLPVGGISSNAVLVGGGARYARCEGHRLLD